MTGDGCVSSVEGHWRRFSGFSSYFFGVIIVASENTPPRVSSLWEYAVEEVPSLFCFVDRLYRTLAIDRSYFHTLYCLNQSLVFMVEIFGSPTLTARRCWTREAFLSRGLLEDEKQPKNRNEAIPLRFCFAFRALLWLFKSRCHQSHHGRFSPTSTRFRRRSLWSSSY